MAASIDIESQHLIKKWQSSETLFYCEGVELSNVSDAAILALGLGGGVVNGFLHHNFPKVLKLLS